jgi:hypothetical protein
MLYARYMKKTPPTQLEPLPPGSVNMSSLAHEEAGYSQRIDPPQVAHDPPTFSGLVRWLTEAAARRAGAEGSAGSSSAS